MDGRVQHGYLGKIDAKTLKVTWYKPPTPHSRLAPHGYRKDGNIVVTEYHGNKVAVFDPKTENSPNMRCRPTPIRTAPKFDKNGDIWASTMSTDRVVRPDPKTGQTNQYLMPSDTNMRTVFVDNTTNPVSFWVGSNHDHALVKVEPLD